MASVNRIKSLFKVCFEDNTLFSLTFPIVHKLIKSYNIVNKLPSFHKNRLAHTNHFIGYLSKSITKKLSQDFVEAPNYAYWLELL